MWWLPTLVSMFWNEDQQWVGMAITIIGLFLGWILPVLAGVATMYFVLSASKKDAQLVTKTIAMGFVIKMVYYGVAIFFIFKLYSFEPDSFMCSFAGFFLGLHALEAVIVKDISK